MSALQSCLCALEHLGMTLFLGKPLPHCPHIASLFTFCGVIFHISIIHSVMCGKRGKKCELFCLPSCWLNDRLRRLAGTLMSPCSHVTNTYPYMGTCISFTLFCFDSSLFKWMPCCCCLSLFLYTFEWRSPGTPWHISVLVQLLDPEVFVQLLCSDWGGQMAKFLCCKIFPMSFKGSACILGNLFIHTKTFYFFLSDPWPFSWLIPGWWNKDKTSRQIRVIPMFHSNII